MTRKYCFYATCKANSRKNPEAVFLPFVKHKTNYLRCKRWIHLCGRKRTHKPEKITNDIYICSQHFPPYEDHDWKKNPNLEPYPVDSKIGSGQRKPRKPPLKRHFGPVEIDVSGPNLAEHSQHTHSDTANSKIILQQSIEKIKKFLFDLRDQNMKPTDVKLFEIQDVIEDLSEIEGSLGETIIKEVYMCPPELLHKAFVNSEIQKETVNLMEKPNSSSVETQPMELEIEGQSFMIQTSIEPEENINIVKSELDPIKIKRRKIPNILRNQSKIKNSDSIAIKHNHQQVQSEINYNDLSENPWKVCNLQEFLRFHCPECDFLSKDENEFHSHAIKNHDHAKEIWGKGVESENILEQDKETDEADIYQESKTYLKENASVKTDETDFEPNTELAEVKSFQVSKTRFDTNFSSEMDESDLRSDTEMVQIYQESKTFLEEDVSAKRFENDLELSNETEEANNYQDSKIFLEEKVSADKLQQMGVNNGDTFCEICSKQFCNKYFLRMHKLKKHGICSPEIDVEPNVNLAKYSETLLKDKAKINLEPDIGIVEAKKLLEMSFNTKSIDVPTNVQARDSTPNVDVDFDSLEVQNVLENTETLFGYDDFRDNFDRYSTNFPLDSSQLIKNDLIKNHQMI